MNGDLATPTDPPPIEQDHVDALVHVVALAEGIVRQVYPSTSRRGATCDVLVKAEASIARLRWLLARRGLV